MTNSNVCINCLACVGVCPQSLLPHFLYHAAIAQSPETLEACRLKDCTACEACDAVCPSFLPLSKTIVEAQRAASAEEGHG